MNFRSFLVFTASYALASTYPTTTGSYEIEGSGEEVDEWTTFGPAVNKKFSLGKFNPEKATGTICIPKNLAERSLDDLETELMELDFELLDAFQIKNEGALNCLLIKRSALYKAVEKARANLGGSLYEESSGWDPEIMV